MKKAVRRNEAAISLSMPGFEAISTRIVDRPSERNCFGSRTRGQWRGRRSRMRSAMANVPAA